MKASLTQSSLLAASLAAALGLLSQGCDTEAYCFACEEADGKAGAAGSGRAGAAGAFGQGGQVSLGGNGGKAGSAGSVGVDTKCGDTQTDAKNCGACGNVCERSGSFATCVAGVCQFTCAEGFSDIDKDAKNGCEYQCLKSSTTELCNGIDDDCDGKVDVDAAGKSVCASDQNCGTFGKTCVFAHSTGVCEDGVCVVGTCNPGFFPDKKKPGKNCDYACKETNGGVELCDLKDNDCDGDIDENPEVSSDPLHCGACDKSCVGVIPNAAPTCKAGVCVLGPCADGYLDKDGDAKNGCEFTCKATCNFPFATGVCQADGGCAFGKCLLGHYDLDGDPSNGCEYGCAISNGSAELCDGLDNNCDGKVDDGFDITTDAKNCGGCGTDCSAYFPGSNVACVASTCSFVSCKTGFFDGDGNNANGCEYACEPTNGGVEICDGKDNDCDGLIDDSVTDVGGACDTGQLGACKAGLLACVQGAAACVATTPPGIEICDGLDNDCDGETDEGQLPEVGFACGTSQVGACTFGTTTCASGTITCVGSKDATTEICNGIDDDCDGVIDDDVTGANADCGSNVGACVPGKNQCIDGAFQCVGGVGPKLAEICDANAAGTGATDENCSGQTDEGCSYPTGGPVRLDVLGSTQGQHSTFQLTGAQSGNDAVVAYTDQRSGGPDVYVAVSKDGGGTWTNPDVGAAATGNAEVEPFPFLRAGKAYVAYSNFQGGDVRRIYVASSTNAALTTWGAGVRVADPGGVDCYSPQGVVANSVNGTDTLAVLWSEIGGTATVPTRNVKLAVSKDAGATWLGAISINTDGGADKGELPAIGTDGAGMVYVAWRDKRIAGLAQTYFTRIDTTVATPVVANTRALQPNVPNASAAQLTIAASGNNVHVGWVDLRGAGTTIRVASSTDKGATFRQVGGVTDGVIVDPDAVQSDATSPALAARGSSIYAVWADLRSGRNDIHVNHSDDAGATWGSTSPRVDTGDAPGATASEFPTIALGTGSKVFVAWQDARFLPTAVLTNVSLDGGLTWHPDAGAVYRLDLDGGAVPAAGAAADSRLPLMFASPTTSAASAVWIDFRAANGSNGTNGDIWTRKLQ